MEQASRVSGFYGAYAAGSTNWLPDDVEQTTTSDLDIVVVVEGQN